jgi:hypothetical protein
MFQRGFVGNQAALVYRFKIWPAVSNRLEPASRSHVRAF